MSKNTTGFTLLELVMVIVIIGILTTFAAPVFIRTVERSRTGEAMRILGQLRLSQMRYYAEWASTTSNWNALDVDPATGKFYNFAIFSTTSPANNTVATATRNTVSNPNYGNYVISITGNGALNCSGGTKCPPIHG